jgi:hypothetical protein
MYKNNMVCCLKANNKVLRENKDIVTIPYGTEFSIFLKNHNTVKAQVKVFIDGVDVTEGVSLVISPNSTFELSRYIKNANLNTGNKFKFIERTAAIEEFKGVGIDDGLVRIEFQYEKVYQQLFNREFYSTSPWNHRVSQYGGPIFCAAPHNSSISMQGASVGYSSQSTLTAADNNAGITVPGSISSQEFSLSSNFPLESDKHVMILKMVGVTNKGQLIETPVTVKSKPKCVTCGHTNKSSAKFCSNCGTSLQIV